MARPKKINAEIMGNDMVEVKKEEENPSDGINYDGDIDMAKPQFIEDKVPDLEVEIVKPHVQEVKEKVPIAICDIEGLSDSDKEIIVEKRIKAILEQTQIPYIPAIVRYKEPETTAIPPMYALVDFDHRFVDEGWKFYQENVKTPYVKDYLLMVQKVMAKPNRIFPRLVIFDYE